jgi:hypothetical protein
VAYGLAGDWDYLLSGWFDRLLDMRTLWQVPLISPENWLNH